MPYWLIVVLFVVVLSVVVFGCFCLLVYLGVRGLAAAHVDPIDPSEVRAAVEASRQDNEWATRNGFEWVGSFRLRASANPAIIILAWQSPGAAAFMCAYHLRARRYYDFVTEFDGGSSVTTGSIADGTLLPNQPGSYTQVFGDADLDTQFAHHMRGEAAVERALGVQREAFDQPFHEYIADEIRAQVRHVRAIPFWVTRVPWWMLTRSRRANMPIERRYPELAPQRV